MVGTLDYLAPEVIKGEPATARPPTSTRSAASSFECIAGAAAVRRAGASSRRRWRTSARSRADPCAGRDDLPPSLSFAVLQALAKRPEDRPPTAAAYALMLRISARPS